MFICTYIDIMQTYYPTTYCPFIRVAMMNDGVFEKNRFLSLFQRHTRLLIYPFGYLTQ
jgi:hypothetical protein